MSLSVVDVLAVAPPFVLEPGVVVPTTRACLTTSHQARYTVTTASTPRFAITTHDQARYRVTTTVEGCP